MTSQRYKVTGWPTEYDFFTGELGLEPTTDTGLFEYYWIVSKEDYDAMCQLWAEKYPLYNPLSTWSSIV